MRSLASLVFMVVACVSSLAACSSSSSSPAAGGCASNPFACPAGQTCAAKDAAGAFACLPSGSGKKADPCQNIVGAPACGDNMTCLQVVQSGGQCVPYCEVGSATHGCAADEQCRAAALQGTSTVFYVCVGNVAPAADAGAVDAASPDSASEVDAAAE